MKYNKLIRDKIPEIIKKENQTPIVHTANRKEYWQKLKEKLKEETNEFLESETKEELVDILEVIYAIYDFKKINKNELEIIRKNKAVKKGKFNKKIILEEIK